MKLSDWIAHDDFCAMRIVGGGEPSELADRVAFIEKTPRVRVAPFTNKSDDWKNWKCGPKGSGGGVAPSIDGTYGFDADSRAWCDEQLIRLGYSL